MIIKDPSIRRSCQAGAMSKGGPACCSVTRGRVGQAQRPKKIIFVVTFPATLASNLSLTWALTKEAGCSHDSQVVVRRNEPTVVRQI